MRCDGRTFTETNGNIVSGKADRAVNRRTNTEQINISKNSSAFSDRLCARQPTHQALSGHFSPQTSNKAGRGLPPPDAVLELWPPSWTRSRGAAVSCPEGKRSQVWAFTPTIVHHEICFLMSSTELSNDAICAAQSRRERLLSMNTGHKRASPCFCPPVHGFCLGRVNFSNTRQWCEAVNPQLPFLTDSQSIKEHRVGPVEVRWQRWALRNS